MTDAAGYRENAELCAAFAERSRSPKDRAVWLLVSSAWLELALVRDMPSAERPSDGSTALSGSPADVDRSQHGERSAV